MRKTTLNVDDRKLARARRVLGTRGIKDTIDGALDVVLLAATRERALDQLRRLNGLDLDDPAVLREAWR